MENTQNGLVTTYVMQVIGLPGSGKSSICQQLGHDLSLFGYSTKIVDIADYHYIEDGNFTDKRRAKPYHLKEKQWLEAVDKNMGSYDFLLVESVCGSDKIETDSVVRVETPQDIIIKRHEIERESLDNEDLYYFSQLNDLTLDYNYYPHLIVDGTAPAKRSSKQILFSDLLQIPQTQDNTWRQERMLNTY